MMNKKIKSLISINVLILSVLIACNNQIDTVYAQMNGDSLVIDGDYKMHEFANFSSLQLNTNRVNISIPSSNWNVTRLGLNFTNIKLGQEVKSIEEGGSSFKPIYKSVKGYGVQLNITEDITLLGVQIYGYLDIASSSSVYVQINGYDQVNHWPNATRYGNPVLINISSIPNWYIQTFPEPIPLAKGYYYLVVNGSEYKSFDNSDHNWFLNEEDSIHTHLYTSKYSSGLWSIEAQGKPFRHKLIQRTDQSFDPEAINMTIKFEDNIYNITDSSPGSGYLKLSNLNLPINQRGFNFPLYHNRSVGLMFNLSYSFELEKYLTSPGTLEITEAHDNHWSVIPTINPEHSNYSVKFNFPEKWSDVTVLRNDINITSSIAIDYVEHEIFISEDLISDGDSWEIIARSSKVDFSLDVSRTEFYAGQQLKFYIATPVLEGNYTFVFTDTYSDEINSTTITIPPLESNVFTYTFSSNALDGSYKAFVYWFNGTDAGVETQTFTVILPEVIDWFLIIGILIIVGSLTAVTASSVVLAKKSKRKKEALKEKTIHKFMDILNLNYVIMIEKKSSLNVYDQSFTGQKFNSTLVSGFLEAIRTFGLDISGSGEHSQTVKLEYQDSKILMSDYKSFRLIFIMKEIPSSQFYGVIEELSLEIEETYGEFLINFKGNLQPFEGLESLLRKHLGTAFLYPLKLSGTGKMKLNPVERALINKSIEVMKKNRMDYFFVTQLIQEITFDSKEIEALYSLIIKRVFNPMT